MQSLDHDSVSLHVDVLGERDSTSSSPTSPARPSPSPEILSCEWLDGATGPVVGARFAARNKVPNRPSWVNKPVVTAVQPGKRFSFADREVRRNRRVDLRVEPDVNRNRRDGLGPASPAR